MLSLISSLGGQIGFLVSYLDNNNYNSVLYELSLLTGFGVEGSLILLQTCLEQVNLVEGEVCNLQLKLDLLAVVIRHLIHQPNFATVICEALKHIPPPNGDFLSDLSKLLKLTLPEQIGLGFALSDAEDPIYQQAGITFCEARIAELHESPTIIIPELLVEQIFWFLHQSESLSKHLPAFLNALPLLQPNYADVPFLSPSLLEEANAVNCLREFDSTGSICEAITSTILELEHSTHVADVIEELGYGCTVDVERCKELLSLFVPLAPQDVARIASMVARTHSGLEDSQGSSGTFFSLLCDSSISTDLSCMTTWDIDVLVTAIKQLAPDLSWESMIKHLDHEGFVLADQKSFSLLMAFYVKGCQDPFPLDAVCGSVWKNTEGQVSFLRYAVIAPPDVFSFAHSPRKLELFDGLHRLVYGSPNHAWISLDLLDILCRLAEAGLIDAIHSLLEYPIKNCPELLLIGLAQVQTEWNLLQNEYFSAMFPAYLSNNTNASAVLHQLAYNNLDLVVRGMVDVHAKDPSSISKILDVCQELKALSVVLDTTPFSFAIDLAALASRREYLNLEKWLNENLLIHRDCLFQACLNFLRERALAEGRSEMIGGVAQRAGPVVALSLETTAIFFKALQAYSGQLSSRDLAEEMRRIHGAAVRVNPRLLGLGASEQTPTAEVFANDIEEEANSYFQKIYTGRLTIEEVVEMLEGFTNSSVQREQEIFGCMIQCLFEEYRFFPRYPDTELQITAVLFGSLIKHQLISSITLGIALRCVLDALRKPLDSKMFSFGMTALEQFKERLIEWPQYCNHLLQISHMREDHSELVDFIERALVRVPSGQVDMVGNVISGEHHQSTVHSVVSEHEVNESGQNPLVSNNVLLGSQQQAPHQQLTVQMQLQQQEERHKGTTGSVVLSKALSQNAALPHQSSTSQLYEVSGTKIGSSVSYQQSSSLSSSQTPSNLGYRASRIAAVSGVVRQPSSTPGFGHALNIETLVAAAERRDTAVEAPNLEIQDKVAFIVNNLVVTNYEAKAKECMEVLKDQYYPWMAQYMVMKRASIEPNYHDTYLKFLDSINSKVLLREIVKATYENCKVLLRSDLIKSSSEERSLLKNLGSWLGKLTIGRNQALRAREIDPKSLIIEAYEKGLMIAVIPFTSKILEPCLSSLAYQPPNPWTMGILSLLAEIYALPNLKMNLKFDIEVLFKNLAVDMKDVKPAQLLRDRQREVEGNPDFSNKDLVTSYGQHPIEHTASVISQLNQVDLLPDLPTVTMHASIPGALSQLSAGPASQQEEEKSAVLNVAERINALPGLSPAAPSPPPYSGGQATPFPNLASYVVVNQKLAGISQQLQLTRIVPVGMERAIREIINPVVDRSVNIACCTTKEIILKDFVMEADDNRTMNSANIMVACLAGSLAHVTCKEPLRVAMASNFRTLLQPHVSPEVLDQAVLIVTNDNLDLGCAVIEKAATEKALRELEELFGTAIANRRKQKDSYYDASYYSQGHFARLPEALRPKPGRLSVTQQRVFEDFARLPWQSPQVSSVVSSTPVAVAPAGAARAPYSIGPGQASLGVVSSSGVQPPSGLATLAQVTEVNAEEVDIRAPSPASFTTSGSMAVPDIGARHSQDAAIDSGNIPGTMTMIEGMNADLSGASKIPGAPVSMPTSPTLSAEQVAGVTSEPSLSTGEAIESYNLLSQKLDAAISRATGGSYSALAPDHEIKVFVTEIQEIITQCISRDEAALAISQKVFKRLYENAGSNLHISAHLAILESIRDVCKRVVKELTSWVIYSDDERRYNREITVGLIKSELINLNDYNIHLAKLMDGGRNTAATEFAIYIVKTCVVQDAGISATELYNVIDALSKVAQRPGSPESLQQLVEIAKNTSSSFSQGVATVAKEDKLKISKDKKPISNRAAIRDEAKITSLADPVGFHEQVVNLFDEWARICNSPGVNDKAYAVYISQLQQSGMLKGDDVSDRFFRLLLELSVIQCLSTDSTLPVVSQQQGQYLSFAAIDMYAKLVVLLVKYYVGEPSMSNVNLLVRVLAVTARVITRDAEEKKTTFHPRPYFRLFLNWLMDFNTSDPLLDSSNFQVLSAFANTLLSLQPLRVPGWSFAWLELISHRMFMPKLLLSNAQMGWPLFQKLLVALFKFMDPYLRNADLSDPVRLLYKGTLRVLLVLLHDFPEFLCDYHFSFCDVIPPSCIQMRNLILSAFPRNMRLPDPFTPNLKVDLLPEISQAPRILSDVENALKSKQLKTEVDEYLKTRQHASLFSVDLKQRLTHSQLETLTSGTRYNVPLINSLVLYVGMQAIQQLQNKSTPQQLAVPTTPITHSAPMDIFQRLIMELDTEGRYLFLNAVANQLRYPNNHTHYFSCVLLYLFAEANQEIIQEQITRVLLERLIVNRPHPWGLLITFIELIKNPRYSFWTHGFTRCAPEIERLFESVARSCMGPPPKPSDEEITSVLNSEGLKG